MCSDNGKIIIRNSEEEKKKWIFEVVISAKEHMTIPSFYDLKDDSLKGQECLVFREKDQIKKITVNNQELFKKVLDPKDSFDIEKTKIPKDTRGVLKDFKQIDNFHLKLNKFSRFENGKPLFFKSKKGKIEFSIYPHFGYFNFKDNLERQEKSIKALFGENIYQFKLTTDYRLLIGSEQSIYETSIRLHHIYGIPFIPSSAIKGVVRSYYIEKFWGKELSEFKSYTDLENNISIYDDDFIYYFGSQDKEGKIIFFDAFPITTPKIKVDIMNPHYGHYYNEGKAPTDDHNPVPINFLTVEDTEFKFCIASRDKIEDEEFIKLFKEALTEHGIGAKTAVGYGYLKE